MAFLKFFLESKRAQGVLVTILVAAFGKKVGLDEGQVTAIVASLLTLVAAIAAGDWGKEAAKIKGAA